MPTPETIGITTCAGCKREADVKLNRGGFAYYHCGCGWAGRSHNQSSSNRFVQAHVRAVNFGDSPQDPGTPEPVAVPEIPGKNQTEQKPEKKSGFRFY